MKTLRQLCRQPLKTLTGIVLMTLAAAIVCLCVGQAMAAKTTKEELNRRFSTVAIPLLKDNLNDGEELTDDSFLLEADLTAWIEQMETEHPDVVKEFIRHGTLSAYIPQMTPFNVTQEPCIVKKVYVNAYNDAYYSDHQSTPLGMPHTGAMFVITLGEISEPKQIWEGWWYEPYRLEREDFSTIDEYISYLQTVKTALLPAGYSVKLTGTVTQVVSIQEGYREPLGRTARLTLNVSTLEELEALNLVPGEQYIVYGTDYSDDQWALFGVLSKDGYAHLELDTFEPDKLKVFTEEEIQANIDRGKGDDPASYYNIMLNSWQLEMLNAFSMTLEAPLALSEFVEIRNAEGYLEDVFEKTEFIVTDANGEIMTLSKEEYILRYQVPTIARLDSTLEEFLTSEEGVLWKTALEYCKVNNHVFTVVGVDRLAYFANFSLQNAHITSGRDFTYEELENGNRVCVIHELVAHNAGLKIGDTITLSFYAADPNLPSAKTEGPLNPMASFYFATTPFAETAEYTIVGFYGGENWPNVIDNPYGMSANTVFVPQTSVQTPMQESDSIVFNSIALHNGMIEEFHELALSAGFAGRFKYNDQDYGTIAANFHNYDDLARQMLTIGAVLYAVLLLLFLILYPGSQKKNVRTMQSFGANIFRRFGYVLASSLTIVIPASLLGGWLGTVLWGRIVETLQTTAESAVALQIEPGTLTQVAAAQLILATVLTVFAAMYIAAPRGISRRK